ncbi:MAG: hypothetical protein IT521_03695 [Burkholderiales bacterium]|nr:hypothetical protein [Burkholderiales bacterium]
MTVSVRPMLRSIAVALAVALSLAGCATRFDASGNEIYRWQFGQDLDRAIDYSNPRLPLLPRWKPQESLWPVPSPYGHTDLSEYSMLAPQDDAGAPIGDNPNCAAPCLSNASLALLAPRADPRVSGRVSHAR